VWGRRTTTATWSSAFRFYNNWHFGKRVRFFGQLTSDVEAGRNGGPAPNMEARLWVEQEFADID
jgi:hypothetical protein